MSDLLVQSIYQFHIVTVATTQIEHSSCGRLLFEIVYKKL